LEQIFGACRRVGLISQETRKLICELIAQFQKSF
jgi:hypothetical protein